MARKKTTGREEISVDANVTSQRIGPFVRSSMYRYGSKVLEDRSIPELRDGLKPAHRRLLFSMHELGAHSTGSFKKSARVTGDTSGKYHPHGNAYSSLVGLSFQRYPLIVPQGSFGNEFDPPAAERYTEVRLAPIASALFDCLDVTTMVPNYSDEFKEPLVFSSRLPLILLNGSDGIAVGLHNILPAHNLKEVIDALIYVVKAGEEANLKGVLRHIKGPDCVSGGILLSSKADIAALYEKGSGRIEYGCEYIVEPDEYDTKVTCIRIVGWPDSWSVKNFVTKRIPKLMDAKLLRSFDILYNQDTCAVREIRVGVDNKPALDAVLKLLRSRTSYALNVTLRNSVDGIAFRPMNLMALIRGWVNWRKCEEVRVLELRKQRVQRTLSFETSRLLAMQNLKVILRALESDEDAEASIMAALNCSAEVASFILELRIRDLKRADISAQRARIGKIEAEIAALDIDLSDISPVVIRELTALRKFQDERRTKIGTEQPDVEISVVAHGDTTAYGVTRDGKVFGDIQPTRTTATTDMFVVGSYQGITLIDSSGLALNLSKMEATGLQSKNFRNIVGIASHDFPHVVAVTTDGSIIKLPMSVKGSDYPLAKSPLVSADSATANSVLIAWGPKGEAQCLKLCDVQENRRNGRGIKLLKFKPKSAIVIHPGQRLYSRAGERLTQTTVGKVKSAADAFLLGKRNLVAYTTGRRAILSEKDAVEALSDSTLAHVWSLDAPTT